MQYTLEDHCRTNAMQCNVTMFELYNLRFADDIDLMAGSNIELQEFKNKLCKCSATYGMEVSYEKNKYWSRIQE